MQPSNLVNPAWQMRDKIKTKRNSSRLVLNVWSWEFTLTSRPTQKEWSCAPHCLAAFVPAKWRAVIEATNDESRPPDSRTPKGTSVISLLITACIYHNYNMSYKPQEVPVHLLINFHIMSDCTIIYDPSCVTIYRSYIFKCTSYNEWIIWGWWYSFRVPRRIIPSP